jgi:hypothetical protein
MLADVYEPNNTLATATNFGTLGDRQAFNLSIDPVTDQDFYKFVAAASGNLFVRTSFVNAVGDLDLYLHNSSGTVIASSTGSDDTEEINLAVTAGQTYTIRVVGFANAVNTYDLLIDGPGAAGIAPDRFENNDSFGTATNFGTLGDRNESNLNIHIAGSDDYFRFFAGSSGPSTLSINFAHNQGDLDLFLYDANREYLNSSEGQSNTEAIPQTLEVGQTYYVRVTGFASTTNPQYALVIDGPAVTGPIVTTSEFEYLTRHAIRFSFDQDVAASIQLTDLAVTNLSTGQAVPASAFTLQITSAAGQPTTAIWVANSLLAAGNYTAVLNTAGVTNTSGQPVGGNTSLSFSVAPGFPADRFETNDSFGAATNLGTLGDRTENNLSIHIGNNDDYYRFIAGGSGVTSISLNFLHSQGNVDLFLYNASQQQLSSSQGFTNSESIAQTLVMGQTYYLRVAGVSGAINPQYGLSVDGATVSGPIVTISEYEYLTRQAIRFSFDQDVTASIQASDLTVTNLTTGQVLPSSAFTLGITGPAGQPTTAVWRANSLLPDGNYTFVLNAAGVTNILGQPVTGAISRSFFVLGGDANRDGKVDISDLGTLASNWQQSGRDLSGGNFDYSADGLVGVGDLGLLASNWQRIIAAPSAPAPIGSGNRTELSRVATDVLR